MARREHVDTKLVIDHLENRCLPSVDFGLTEPQLEEGLGDDVIAMTLPETNDERVEQAVETSAMLDGSDDAPVAPVESAQWDGTDVALVPESTILSGRAVERAHHKTDDADRIRHVFALLGRSSDADLQLLRWKHETLHAAYLAHYESQNDSVEEDASTSSSQPTATTTSDAKDTTQSSSTAGTSSGTSTETSYSSYATPTSEAKPRTYESSKLDNRSVETIETSAGSSSTSTTKSSTGSVDRTKVDESSSNTASSTNGESVISKPRAELAEDAVSSTSTGPSAEPAGEPASPPVNRVDRAELPPAPALPTGGNVPAAAISPEAPVGESAEGSEASPLTSATTWTGPIFRPIVVEMRALGERAAGTGLSMVSAIVKQVAGSLTARSLAAPAAAEQAPAEHAEPGAPALPELLAGVSDLAPNVLLGNALLADPQLHAMPPAGSNPGTIEDADGIVRELAASAGVVAVSATVDRLRRRRKASAGLLGRCSEWLRRTLRLDRSSAGRPAAEADTHVRSSAADISRNWIRLDDTEVAESSNANARPGTTPWTIAR